MTDLERMEQAHRSFDLYDKTGDIEHLEDALRFIEYKEE